jgi:hypothetical protein
MVAIERLGLFEGSSMIELRKRRLAVAVAFEELRLFEAETPWNASSAHLFAARYRASSSVFPAGS